MKLFIDTANLNQIRQAMEWGILAGVTTNPTLVAREGGDFKDTILEIARLVPGPISVEVLSKDSEGIVEEAREFSSWADNIVIKVPITPEGIKSVRILNGLGIKTNVTLVFSLNQALIATTAGADYVSPFIGRIDDIGYDGIALLKDIVCVFSYYKFSTQVIAASIRHPLHLVEAMKCGAHIATVPFDVLEKMFNHPLTQRGIEQFLKDWERVYKK